MNYCWHAFTATRPFPIVQAQGLGLECQKGGREAGGNGGAVDCWDKAAKVK